MEALQVASKTMFFSLHVWTIWNLWKKTPMLCPAYQKKMNISIKCPNLKLLERNGKKWFPLFVLVLLLWSLFCYWELFVFLGGWIAEVQNVAKRKWSLDCGSILWSWFCWEASGWLGGGFKHFLCSTLPRETIQFDKAYFSVPTKFNYWKCEIKKKKL